MHFNHLYKFTVCPTVNLSICESISLYISDWFAYLIICKKILKLQI